MIIRSLPESNSDLKLQKSQYNIKCRIEHQKPHVLFGNLSIDHCKKAFFNFFKDVFRTCKESHYI